MCWRFRFLSLYYIFLQCILFILFHFILFHHFLFFISYICPSNKLPKLMHMTRVDHNTWFDANCCSRWWWTRCNQVYIDESLKIFHHAMPPLFSLFLSLSLSLFLIVFAIFSMLHRFLPVIFLTTQTTNDKLQRRGRAERKKTQHDNNKK